MSSLSNQKDVLSGDLNTEKLSSDEILSLASDLSFVEFGRKNVLSNKNNYCS